MKKKSLTGISFGVPDRREFLKSSAALGLGAVAAASLPGANARAATPNMGGTLRYGIGHGSTTDSMDPGTYENDFTIFTGYCFRGHLTEIAPDGSVKGDLAKSWEASPDAATWTFKLRKGVEFHNGKTVDANDVVASWNHHRGEDSKSAAKPLVDPIVDIKADGNDTVIFTLNAGNADFPFIASDYHLAIMPAVDGKADWASGVGTGAYTLENWDPGIKAEFKRQPNFYKANAAFFDGVQVFTIADANSRVNAIKSGEVDFIDRVDLKIANLLGRDPGIDIFEVSGTAHYTIPMDTRVAPFDNNDVRLALKYALDREALVKTILLGHGVVGNDHPIGTANRYHADDLPQRTYDPDKAKFHLKKAGLTSLSVDLSAADAAFAGAVDSAVLYREHAANAGIDINVIREPSDGYWSSVWMQKAWCFSYWGGRPTEDWMFSTAYAEGASWNETHWSHDRFNKLLAEGRSELDDSKRRAIYYDMQQICSDEGGAVVPMFNNYVNAVTTKLHIPDQVASNWNNDGHKMTERWWFNA